METPEHCTPTEHTVEIYAGGLSRIDAIVDPVDKVSYLQRGSLFFVHQRTVWAVFVRSSFAKPDPRAETGVTSPP